MRGPTWPLTWTLDPGSRHEAAFLHPHAERHDLRVLAINRPGVGRSSLPPAPGQYDFPTVVEAVRQLLDSAGLRRVVFMGTSDRTTDDSAPRTTAVCLVASMTHTRNAPGLLQVARAMRQQPELVALMSGSGREALAQGLAGLWADMRLTSEPWGLPLERITAPTFVWQVRLGSCVRNGWAGGWVA
eukprot:XP_001695924.1 predicted protein [Chlamydomonas reinhardtii]